MTYGSILIAVTFRPILFRSKPVDEAVIPLPIPEMTPPDTRTYLMAREEVRRS